MKSKMRKLITTVTAVVTALLMSVTPVLAGEGGAGTNVYLNRVDLGNGVTYENAMSQNATYGIQQSHSFAAEPGTVITPVILACDTIYGGMNMNKIVEYAGTQGYNVLAALNTDFFSTQTGVPMGLVIEDGIYKCSPEGRPSLLLDDRGQITLLDKTTVNIRLTNQGGGELLLTENQVATPSGDDPDDRNSAPMGTGSDASASQDTVPSGDSDNPDQTGETDSVNQNGGSEGTADAGTSDQAQDAEGEGSEDASDVTGEPEEPAEPEIPVSNAGKYVELTHFNKTRQAAGGLYLYDEYFSTVSTRTSTEGWAVKMKILEGSMKTKGTVSLEVVQVYEGSSPLKIGSGYMVLTADSKAGMHYQFEKFRVGDRVILETSCNSAALENAQWGTGTGDILVRDGQMTSSSGWDSDLLYKNPRSALGVKADGTILLYEIDGRQAGHSNGISMKQLAQEMIDQGCVTAVNFDGGGSSVIAGKLPGSDTAKVLNSPSDGSQRKCSTYLLLVSGAVSDRRAALLSLEQAGTVVYQGASLDLSFLAIDKANTTVTAPQDISAEVTEGYGSITGNTYTAGWVAGMETISLTSPSTGVSGTSSIYVTKKLTEISVKADGKAVTSLKVDQGDQIQFTQTAKYYGRDVVMGKKSYQYTLSGDDIAEITDTGLLTIHEDATGSAVLTIASGGVVKNINITVNSVFSDITGHWAEAYIAEMYEQGIVSGTGSGRFSPANNIKRADFMVMLYRASGSPETETSSSGFADVDDGAYYAAAVKWAQALGIAKGDGTNFHPEKSMTREDAFCFLHRYLSHTGAELSAPAEDILASFSDSGEFADYARESAAVLAQAEIVNGSGGKIRPKGMLTRAEMCKILSVSLKK